MRLIFRFMKSPLRRIRVGAVSLLAVLIVSVIGFRFVGDYSWLDSIWMVVITISTVGFSESSQSTPAVQLFTIVVIVLGVSCAAYTCGGFIQLLLEGEIERALGTRKMTKEIQRLKNHVVICGYGRLGQDLSEQLRHRGIEFVVVDLDLEKTQRGQEDGALTINGDATAEETLMKSNLTAARALVTALPSDADNVFITLTTRMLAPKIQIVAKAEQETSCRKLKQAGADKIVMPHHVGARQMERMITRPHTADMIELFAEASVLDMEIDELQVAENSPLAGKTLEATGISKHDDLLVVAVRSGESKFLFKPQGEFKFAPNDVLLVMGTASAIGELKRTHQLCS